MSWPILEAMAEIQKYFHSFFGSNEDIQKSFWNYLTFSTLILEPVIMKASPKAPFHTFWRSTKKEIISNILPPVKPIFFSDMLFWELCARETMRQYVGVASLVEILYLHLSSLSLPHTDTQYTVVVEGCQNKKYINIY